MVIGSLGWSRSLLARGGGTGPDDIFWKAVRQARERALFMGVEVMLLPPGAPTGHSSDREEAFVLRQGSREVGRVPLTPPKNAAPKIRFLTADLKRSTLLQPPSTATALSAVVFFPDGTCTPFRLEIVEGSSTRHLAVDPWTCAPLLKNPEGRSR